LNGDLVEGLTKETPARFLPLESVEEASGEMLRRVRVPAQVPERLGKPSVTLITASQSSYLVDLPKLHTALADAGVADLQLPPNLHGKKLLLNVGAGVRLQWGSGPGALRLVQTRQPTVVVPAEIDVDGLRDLILGHPDLADGSAAVSRLREVADWRATFPLPIPDGWTSEEVAVDQTEGLLVRPGSVGLSALFWQRAGIVYVLSGALPPDHLIAVADSL
jgi:hypothetical protein